MENVCKNLCEPFARCKRVELVKGAISATPSMEDKMAAGAFGALGIMGENEQAELAGQDSLPRIPHLV